MQFKKALSRTGWVLIFAGAFLCIIGCRLLFALLECWRTGLFSEPEIDQADMLLIFPVIFKLFGFIMTPLLQLLTLADAVFLLTGCIMLISGIVSLCANRRIQKKEYAETEQKLKSLRDDGALTEEEYTELLTRLNKTHCKHK